MPVCRPAAAALVLALLPASLTAQAGSPRSVVLVTIDGVRPAEFFGGMDPGIAASADASGIRDSAGVWQRYWRPDPVARRRAVMPFFWDSLAPRGLVLGDSAHGSRVRISNGQGFSAPGYVELLTGRAQPEVTSNRPVRYPHATVLQYARRALGLGPMQVATFASWSNLRYYAASVGGAVYVNAGFDTVPEPFTTPRLAELAALASTALPVWDDSRLDAFTAGEALEYLRRHRPRLLYVSFNDTDDFAHLRRYDRVLDAMRHADDFLRVLWGTLASLPEYRGRTTLVITTDHGRGLTPEQWPSHGRDTEGSQGIWLAVIGPSTAARGLGGGDATLAQVAATVLRCLGLDPAGFGEGAAPAVPGACDR